MSRIDRLLVCGVVALVLRVKCVYLLVYGVMTSTYDIYKLLFRSD